MEDRPFGRTELCVSAIGFDRSKRRGLSRRARRSIGRVLALAGGGLLLAGAADVKDAIRTSEAGNREAKASQERIDVMSDDIDALATEYRAALEEARSLEVYNRQLAALVTAQGREMESLQQQIDNVTVVGRQVMPLMARMLDTLEQFVAIDMPFLPEERSRRIAALREMMGRADVSISEKYRRILEAYQIENEYGRTIEAYRGPIEIDGQDLTVDFLRVGRIALLYQTLDGNQQGVWDPTRKAWVPLDGQYRSSIQKGLRIARKETAPDLIRVPVPAARRSEVPG